MPVQVRCECGKRYRVADAAGGKRLRCNDCGAELIVPRQKPEKASDDFDDGLDIFDIDSPQSVADHFSAKPRLPPRASRSRTESDDDDSSSGGVYALGDVIVRGSALFVFLVTLGNCAYHLLKAEAAPGQGQVFDVFTWGIVPLVVAGPFSLYIAWIGEEPDPEARHANRIAGLVKCGIGAALAALGGILTIVVSVFLAKLAGFGVAFTGLIFGGVMMIAYGGLSVLTGREFTKAGLTNTRQSDRRVRSADGSGRRTRRQAISAPYANLIGLMVVAGALCIVAALAVMFWPADKQDDKPDVAEANRVKMVPQRAAPKFVPPALPPAPVLPPNAGFPPNVRFPPGNQPANQPRNQPGNQPVNKRPVEGFGLPDE